VADGWRALGSVEVISQTAFAHDQLWRGGLQSAIALGVVGVLAGLLAALAVGRIQRPLEETVRQAESLQRGEYVSVAEPKVPELRRLTRTMNSMVARLRTVFEGQAAQVESLRRQTSLDALTGLSNRSHFMAQLNAQQHHEDGAPDGGLVLLRVLRLAEMNRRLGHVETDRTIATIGRAIQALVQSTPGAFAGRLNGADFGFSVPTGGGGTQHRERAGRARACRAAGRDRRCCRGRRRSGGAPRNPARRADGAGRPRSRTRRGGRRRLGGQW
jgi:GGDEF domain-containing protein